MAANCDVTVKIASTSSDVGHDRTLAPIETRNGPVMLLAPSRVLSEKALTTPIARQSGVLTCESTSHRSSAKEVSLRSSRHQHPKRF
jgi:hypothetical protein